MGETAAVRIGERHDMSGEGDGDGGEHVPQRPSRQVSLVTFVSTRTV